MIDAMIGILAIRDSPFSDLTRARGPGSAPERFSWAAIEPASLRHEEVAGRAQIDRLRRRYSRQTEAACTRQDGHLSGTRRRSVRGPASEAWSSCRSEGRAPQERNTLQVATKGGRQFEHLKETK